MNKPLKITLGIIGFLLVAFLGLKFYMSSQSEAQYEAVVRDFAQRRQEIDKSASAKIFFVSVQRQDPSPEFLARFQGTPYAVRPGSRALSTSVWDSEQAKDNQTGEVGVKLNITRTFWTGMSSAIVYANGDGFVVTKDGGTWHVEYMTIMEM